MAHIQVPEGVPGIRSLVMFRPETGKPLYELAQVLLRGESPLSEAERELIAAYVSHRKQLHVLHEQPCSGIKMFIWRGKKYSR